jgi:DNA-binding response OmpR family regulator
VTAQQPKVIIIESDENLRYLYNIALEFQSLNVLTASTIADGLDKIESVKPDLVLVDEVVPDFEKFDLIKELNKRLPGKIPAILVTNLRDEADREIEQGKIMAAIRYLVKSERTVGNIIRASRKAVKI